MVQELTDQDANHYQQTPDNKSYTNTGSRRNKKSRTVEQYEPVYDIERVRTVSEPGELFNVGMA